MEAVSNTTLGSKRREPTSTREIYFHQERKRLLDSRRPRSTSDYWYGFSKKSEDYIEGEEKLYFYNIIIYKIHFFLFDLLNNNGK
jgi:hypothetical protein